MRYTVYGLQKEIKQIDIENKNALDQEDALEDQVFMDKIYIEHANEPGADGWDLFEANKAKRYLQDDLKSVQRQRNVRWRLEKKRILLMMIKKIHDQ